jgi:hypothetical protein
MLVLDGSFVSELTYLVDIKSRGIIRLLRAVKMNVLTAVCLFVIAWVNSFVLNHVVLPSSL